MQRIDLLNHNFTRAFRGYSPQEVDDFIQDIVDTMARMSDERLRLMKKVQRLEKQLITYAAKDHSLQKTLLTSQKIADDMQEQAQKEAMVIIDTAKIKAEQLTQEARRTLMALEEDIAKAKSVHKQFEETVRTAITSHLQLLTTHTK